MSMLAETTRKQKWSLNPQGKQWSKDPNKLGQRMLMKMGWTHGKGLGINEQGTTEHIRMALKSDKTGIGFNQSLDKTWTEQQEKFNEVLEDLQNYQDQEIIQKRENNDKDISGQSLELKSKQSRTRLHYKKFTHGKDLSTYSVKELANIFGQKELINKTPVKIEKDDMSIYEKKTTDTDNVLSIVTINSGNMTDYFKHKMPKNKKSDMTSNRAIDFQDDTKQYIDCKFTTQIENILPSTYESLKDSDKKNNYAFDNPYLELNSPETVSNVDDFSKKSAKKRKKESESADLQINETDKLNVRKKLKTEIIDNCKDGFTNLALNLAAMPNENCNGKEFEVSRAQFGLENCGLDLTDEKSNKKRVTFNDHVEYSTDSIKKKKITLDKYEVKSKKHKKKWKHENINIIPVSNGFVNEALDVEILSEEINDNKLNECKMKVKRNKLCKMSNLEIIQESPEQEQKISEIKTGSEVIMLDTSLVKNEEIDILLHKKSKKKKKKVNTDDIDIITVDITNEKSDIKFEKTVCNKNIKTDNEIEVITSKKCKKKKKDKRDSVTELVKETVKIETNNMYVHDQQDIRILEKSDIKQQNDDSIKKKNTKKETLINNSAKIETIPVIEIEKEKLPLENTVRKKKKEKSNNSGNLSENEINTCDIQKDISDKENADEEQNVSIEKLPKKNKKRKKSKEVKNISEVDFSSNTEVTDMNISKLKNVENAEFIETLSKKNKVVDAIDNIIHSPWNEKAKMSKKMLKILFYKNLADFPGSNIQEIKGYGVDTDFNS